MAGGESGSRSQEWLNKTTMNPPDPPNRPKLRELFLEALDRPEAAAREAFLDQACAGHPALRERVRALLQHHREDGFLESPASLDPSAGEPGHTAEGASASAAQPANPLPPRSLQPGEPRNPRLRYFGDYELLEEVARGGMGIVYRARQVSLNRVVAVKMILAGQLATEADVKRFHTEAEAAANLQHPNIVAIHEIGEHDGQHYFSMDFVEGSSLADEIKRSPFTAVRAAVLLQTLAEAVHHAHQRGTLHRDLKPQNVLLDAAGRPRITDFGLAKRVQDDSTLTRTGTVMGSPNYMPPEQATGRLPEMGPASDVYALGAMLYEMLTGVPPFARGTAVETLRAMLEEEPVPPAKRRPDIPPDLATICLKCLEKRPIQRYSSARELAEELGRFLHHEPIQARPVHAGRQALAWCRRHPWMLTAATTVAVLGLAGLAYGLWQQTRFLVWRHAHPESKLPAGQLQDLGGLGIGAFFLLIPLAVAIYWRMHTRSGPTWLGRRLHLPEALLVGPLFATFGLWSMLGLIRDLVWTRWEPGDLLAAASMTFVICWTGLILVWKHVRTHGAPWMSLPPTEPAAPGWALRLDVFKVWLGVAASAPLSTWIGSVLVEWGQFRPEVGFLANGRYVMAPAQEVAYEEGLRGLFSLFTTFVILITVMAGTAWRSPKASMWRETSPMWIGFWLSGCGLGLAILPTALSACAGCLGVVLGLLLLALARMRRVTSTPTSFDRWRQAFRVNQSGLLRSALIAAPALVLVAWWVGTGTIGERMLGAMQLTVASLLGAIASAFRNAGFGSRRVVFLMLVLLLPVSQGGNQESHTLQAWFERLPFLLAAATTAWIHYRAGLLPAAKAAAGKTRRLQD